MSALTAQLEKAKSQYQALSPQDQRAAVVLSILAVGLVLYLGLWAPINEFRHQQEQTLNQYAEDFRYLQTMAQQQTGAGSATKPGIRGSLISVVEASARRFAIKPNRLQPEGNNAISVQFERVGFNQLVQWLLAVEKMGISIDRITVDKHEDQGFANSRVVLRT